MLILSLWADVSLRIVLLLLKMYYTTKQKPAQVAGLCCGLNATEVVSSN
jgi:hypothetical protein